MTRPAVPEALATLDPVLDTAVGDVLVRVLGAALLRGPGGGRLARPLRTLRRGAKPHGADSTDDLLLEAP